MQFEIKPPFGEELVMRTDLADLALIEDDDLVGFTDRR